jgi:hypothetical protein
VIFLFFSFFVVVSLMEAGCLFFSVVKAALDYHLCFVGTWWIDCFLRTVSRWYSI